MISVPDAGLLPSTPRPVWCIKGSTTSCGKPCGYVGIGWGVTTPISSQCPVVVSLPFERSARRPATAGAPGWAGQPSSGSTLPRPSASRLGRSRPPTALATFPSVSEPRRHSRLRRAALLRRRRQARSRRRAPRGYSRSVMATVLGLLGLLVFIVAVIALAAGITWLVV